MPHSTRLSTPITRSYLSDPWLNAIDDALAREFFLRAKLACDNLGRMPGDPGMLAGILFPGVSMNRSRVKKVIDILFKARLIFYYQVGRQWFLEICDTGITQTLVGNMSDKSEYPAPPQGMVKKWESFTGRKHIKIERTRTGSDVPRAERIQGMDTVKTGTNGVHTGLNESEQRTTVRSGSSQVGHSQGRNGSDFAKPANACDRASTAAAKPADKTYGQCIDDPSRDSSLHILSGGKFLADLGFREYEHKDEFLGVVQECFEVRRNIPLGGKPEAVEFMGHVMNRCNAQGFNAPKGWLRSLSELRAEVKGRTN